MIMLALAALLNMPAATPLQAAQRFLRTGTYNKSAKTTVQVQTPNFALVGYANAAIEGWKSHGQLLGERFPFGWQLVDISVDRTFQPCELHRHAIPDYTMRRLGPFIGKNKSPNDCALPHGDKGPPADIAVIRRLMDSHNVLLWPVHVIKDYAVVVWWGAGGGQEFFHKVNGHWSWLFGGGGAAGVGDLVGHQVPPAIAKQLLGGL